MMSPGMRPALAAGPFGSTLLTWAPEGLGRPSGSAMSFVTSVMATPMRPRTTRPLALSWSVTRIASSMGMANEMPMKPPVRL